MVGLDSPIGSFDTARRRTVANAVSTTASRLRHAGRTVAVAVVIVAVIRIAGVVSHRLALSLGIDALVEGTGSAVLFFVFALLALFVSFLLYSDYYAIRGGD